MTLLKVLRLSYESLVECGGEEEIRNLTFERKYCTQLKQMECNTEVCPCVNSITIVARSRLKAIASRLEAITSGKKRI